MLEWEAASDDKPSIATYSTGANYLSDYHAARPAFWLTVAGESMSAAHGRSIPAGSRILVDPLVEPVPGNLVLMCAPDQRQALFRELQEEGGRRYLRALNPAWPVLGWEEGWRIKGTVMRAMLVFD